VAWLATFHRPHHNVSYDAALLHPTRKNVSIWQPPTLEGILRYDCNMPREKSEKLSRRTRPSLVVEYHFVPNCQVIRISTIIL
jgi:hypothetical protein